MTVIKAVPLVLGLFGIGITGCGPEGSASTTPASESEQEFVGQLTTEDVQAIQQQLILETDHVLILTPDARKKLTPLQYDFARHAIERTNWLAANSGLKYARRSIGTMLPEDMEESETSAMIWCGDVVENASWIRRDGVWSDSISPTLCGMLGWTGFNNWNAWVEVVDKTPSHYAWSKAYGTPAYWSMYDQFVCHFFEGGMKTPWNLEPTRPNVGLAATIRARCNPPH